MSNKKEEEKKESTLYGWLFTFNHYMGKWAAYNRDTKYFNGDGPVWFDEDLNNLVDTIKKETNERNSKS